MVRPYKVTRTHKKLGLFPIETAWEAELLLSDVYFADCPQDSFRRTYARKALLTVLKDTAPFDDSEQLKWEQLKFDVMYKRVSTTR